MSTGDKINSSVYRFDLISRGSKKPTPLGTALFCGLRAADPILQYGILAHGVGATLLQKLGLEVLPAGLPINTGLRLIDGLGLSPYRLILLAMTTGSTVKQIFWLMYTSKDEFPPAAAVAVSAYNTLVNSLNNLLFTTVMFSASLSNGGSFPQPPLVVGSLLYLGGILTETMAEIQRKKFKDDRKNDGKPFTGGLWSYARHVNYTAYSVWRMGYALASAGWGWGLVVGLWCVGDFSLRAIPVLDDYCTKRYGQQWAEFKRKTPYAILPGVW